MYFTLVFVILPPTRSLGRVNHYFTLVFVEQISQSLTQMTNMYSIDHYCGQSTYLRRHYCGTHIWTLSKDIDPDSLVALNHKNNRYFILILAFNVKFYRVSYKLQAPTRSTTTAVNLQICVATIAAHRYKHGAKEIDQYSIVNWYRKNKRNSVLYFSFCSEESVTNDLRPLVFKLSFSEIF